MPDWLSSPLPVVVALSAIAVALYLARHRILTRRASGSGAPVPRHVEANVSWLGTYSQAFQRVLDVLELLDARLVSADPNHGTVLARTEPAGAAPPILPVTLRFVLTTQQGVTLVHLEAVPSVPFLPSGARRLVEEFIRTWDRLPAPSRAQSG